MKIVKMSRNERNGSGMVGNGGKWLKMQKYDGKMSGNA